MSEGNPQVLQRRLSPVLSRSFTICAALTLVAGFGLLLGARRMLFADQKDRKHIDSIGRLEEARSNTRSAVSNMRAYFLSAEARYQQLSTAEIDSVRENLVQYAEVSGKGNSLGTLQTALNSSASLMSQLMADRAESGPGAAARLASNSEMTNLIDQLESGISKELNEQSNIITTHREKRQDDFLLTEIAFICTFLFGCLSLALATASLKRESQHRRVVEAQHANVKQDLLTIQSMLELSDQKDQLTTLLNREAFDHILAQEYVKNRKSKHPISLVIIHVDQLLQVRESRGNRVADEVLRTAAAKVKDSFRGGDVCCRFGDAEFAVILPRTTLQNATVAAERTRLLIEQAEWSDCNVTASFGVAQADYLKEHSELLARTEQAVDYARRTGRNRVTAIRAYLPLSA